MDRTARAEGLDAQVIATLFALMALWQIFAIATYFSSVSNGCVAAGAYVVLGGFSLVRRVVLRSVLDPREDRAAPTSSGTRDERRRDTHVREDGRVVIIDLRPGEYTRM